MDTDREELFIAITEVKRSVLRIQNIVFCKG